MSCLGNFANSCWKTVTCAESTDQQQEHHDDDDNNNNDNENEDDNDHLVWSKDLERHSCGEFSYAVAQANRDIEDRSQVETGSNAIFVGIYDGHAGPYAAKYINRSLFDHLIRIARDRGTISQQTLEEAISATEEGFMTLVERAQLLEPLTAVSGSSCLIGVIWKGTLFTAHLGNCRAVIGVPYPDDPDRFLAVQMRFEHDVNSSWVRQKVKNSHPDDPNIVVRRDGVWRIKGVTQVSKSIGDAYLKRNEFKVHPSLQEFQFPGPLTEPVLSADPDLNSRAIEPTHRFIIFASHGFWEHLISHTAAEIVFNNPRRGIARRLVKAAQEEAARKANISYRDLHNIDKGNRLAIHDDMTVVVVFIDHELVGQKDTTLQEMSIKGFTDSVGQSNFRNIDDLM